MNTTQQSQQKDTLDDINPQETNSKKKWFALGLIGSVLLFIIAVIIGVALWVDTGDGTEEQRVPLTEAEKAELLGSLSRTEASRDEKQESLTGLEKNSLLTPEEKLQLLKTLNKQ